MNGSFIKFPVLISTRNEMLIVGNFQPTDNIPTRLSGER